MGRDGPLMIAHHFLTDGQADAGAVKLAPTGQLVKDLNDPLNGLLIEANPIVCHLDLWVSAPKIQFTPAQPG